jgi:NAD(P)-dependent dehydrogenase (short-subunit alcohol dehydrogenase family)
MHRFSGKVAIVTGAARGIGFATARRLASEGASVGIVDVDVDAAEKAADAIRADGAEVTFAPCDVRERSSIESAVSQVVETFGRLDVLVNNVGIASPIGFAETDDAEWERQVDPTLRGAMRCIQVCLPHLLAAPGGAAVVSISSVNGMAAIGGVAYSSAKAGLISASQNLAVEFGRRAQGALDAESGWIRFNVVAPGTVRTRAWTETAESLARMKEYEQLYPAGRVGEPADIAAAVAFLASSDADWITGVTLPVDGGLLAGPATFRPQ